MDSKSHETAQLTKPHFIRGMTLQQYVSSIGLSSPFSSNPQETSQGSLLEKSEPDPVKPQLPGFGSYPLRSVEEQESCTASRCSSRAEFAKVKKNNQPTKETFREDTLAESGLLDNPPRQREMRSTAHFKDHQNFRVKQLSCSPAKKSPPKMLNPSLTVFGQKFTPFKDQQVLPPELITFYGKKEGMYEPGKRSKCLSKPVRLLNLEDLAYFQEKIKGNFSQKVSLSELRKSSLRDKLTERINKFC